MRARFVTVRERGTNMEDRRLASTSSCWIGIGSISINSFLTRYRYTDKERNKKTYVLICMCYFTYI